MCDKNKKDNNYQISYDNLAIPEVHTGHFHPKKSQIKSAKKKSVSYDTVAIPEVHIEKK